MLRLSKSLPDERQIKPLHKVKIRRPKDCKCESTILRVTNPNEGKIVYCVRIQPQSSIHADCIVLTKDEVLIAGLAYEFAENDEVCAKSRNCKGTGLMGGIILNGDYLRRDLNARIALANRVLTYYLEIPVSAKTANNCISFWKSAKESSVRRKYNYYFNNCSTAVYAALEDSWVVPPGCMRFPIITPRSLYYKLQDLYSGINQGAGFLGVDFENKLVEFLRPESWSSEY